VVPFGSLCLPALKFTWSAGVNRNRDIRQRLSFIRRVTRHRDSKRRARWRRSINEQDTELAAAARKLIALIEQHAPGAAAAIGVDLKDVSAANLRLADIAAAGTGVKVERGTFTGDIDIRGVRAGVPPRDPEKGG
jgi:hypothetical protein